MRNTRSVGLALIATAIVGLILLFQTGCANWQVSTTKSLEGAHKIGQIAFAQVTATTFCQKQIDDCKHARLVDDNAKCESLQTCQNVRRNIVQSVDTLQRAVLIGLFAVEAGTEKDAQTALGAALASAMLIRKGLETWGIKP